MNFNDNFDLKKATASLLSENYEMGNVGTLDEMALIIDDLKDAIETVISANSDLDTKELKQKIKTDADVQAALAGERLHDNQLNRFIDLTRGDRENKARGRKAGTSNAAPRATLSADVISYLKGLSQTSPLWNTYMENPSQAIADAKGNSAPESEEKKKVNSQTLKIKNLPKSEPKSSSTERDVAQELKDLKAQMKDLSAKYQAGDESALEKLKPLTAKLKQLNKEAGI
jgi:hypothetical protein